MFDSDMVMFRHLVPLAICLSICTSNSNGDEAAEKMILASYKLSNEASTATGFVVHRVIDGNLKYFVVTAEHVLKQMKGDSCTIVSRRREDSGTYQRVEIEVNVRAGGKDLWRGDKAHDVAVLPLPENLTLVSVPYECLATEQDLEKVYAGDSVRSPVFPERTEANGAGLPVLRGAWIASFPLRPIKHHAIFLIDVNSWKGDSGAAVMHATVRHNNDWPLILGYTRGMQNITDTVSESRFVTKRTDYPLGLSVIGQAMFARNIVESF